MQKPILMKEAAAVIGVTPGRLRQVCTQHNLGTLLNPRLRVLSPSDLNCLKVIIGSFTPRRPRKKK